MAISTTSLPKVSVCIPAFNSEDTLRDTLISILNQDYHNLDIVVSDNQSTDDTAAVIKSLSGQGVRYVQHGKGRPAWADTLPSYIGGFANWNYVLSKGIGEYLCLYHADDIYDATIISKQVALMEQHPNVGAVFAGWRAIGEDWRPIRMGTCLLPKEFAHRQVFDFPTLLNATLKYNNLLLTSSVMLRRSVLDQLDGFDERQFLTSSDLEMWLRIARKFDIGVINEPLVGYRQSEKQFGKQYQRLRTQLHDYFNLIDHYLKIDDICKIATPKAIKNYEMERSADYILCAMSSLVKGQVVLAREHLSKALQWQNFVTALKRPRKFTRLLLGIIMLFSAQVGLGKIVGKGIFNAYQFDLRRRRKSP